MIAASRIGSVASSTGFRSEIVEKVLYLEAILHRMGRHPGLTASWVLKGGDGAEPLLA